MLLITDELINHFAKYTRKSAKLQLIHMTVDQERFAKKIPLDDEGVLGKYIAYAGHLWGNKDGVQDLLKSFFILSKDFPDIKLFLIGDNSNLTEFKILQTLIRNLNFEERVIFTGRIERDEIPKYLSNATLLVLAIPNNIQAKGGFPTKLGEYLITGVPTLITNVGENAKYVHDGEHVFFAKPNDPTDYAEKLLFILNNYNSALTVAKNGRAFVLENYSHIKQGKRLSDFLQNL